MLVSCSCHAHVTLMSCPLLTQSQQDLESRLTEVLDKISVLESRGGDAGPLVPPLGGEGREVGGRLAELEERIANMTQKRLDHVEKMQRHQMQLQVGAAASGDPV